MKHSNLSVEKQIFCSFTSSHINNVYFSSRRCAEQDASETRKRDTRSKTNNFPHWNVTAPLCVEKKLRVPAEGRAFGSLVARPPKTTIVEGLVIPAKLDGVQATNFVLTQQVRNKKKGQARIARCIEPRNEKVCTSVLVATANKRWRRNLKNVLHSQAGLQKFTASSSLS